MLDPSAGVSYMWLEPLAPWRRSLSLRYPSPFLGPPSDVQIPSRLLLLPSYQIPCESFSRALVKEDPFCQSLGCSNKSCSACCCIFDEFMEGKEVSVLLTLSSGSLPALTLSLK